GPDAEERRLEVAGGDADLPPALAPGADAALLPLARELGDLFVHAAWHGAEGVVDQIGGVLQDWKLRAQGEQIFVRSGHGRVLSVSVGLSGLSIRPDAWRGTPRRPLSCPRWRSRGRRDRARR